MRRASRSDSAERARASALFSPATIGPLPLLRPVGQARSASLGSSPRAGEASPWLGPEAAAPPVVK